MVVGDALERIIDEAVKHAEKTKYTRLDLNKELTRFLERNLGCFRIEDYDEFKKKYGKDIKEIEPAIKSISPDNINEPGIKLLYCLGSITVCEDYFVPGYIKGERFFWPSIVEILDRFQVAYSDRKERRVFEREIKSNQNITRYPHKVMNELLDSWARQIDCSMLIQAIDKLGRNVEEEFQDYPDPLSFYQKASLLYRNKGAKGPIIVFSITPGLVIPVEYEGTYVRDRKTGKYKKHPYRKSYFDNGIVASCVPVKYQWDPVTTGRRLRRWIRGKGERKEKAIKHLAGFLALPHIEITEAPFQEWKVYFTLTSPDFGCVFSQRDSKIKPICHGLLADPRNERAPVCFRTIGEHIGAINRTSLFEIVNECYEKGEKRLLKPLNKCYSGKEGLELAEEIINNLLRVK